MLEEWSDGTVAAWAKARKSSYLLMKYRTGLTISERAESYKDGHIN